MLNIHIYGFLNVYLLLYFGLYHCEFEYVDQTNPAVFFSLGLWEIVKGIK